MDIIVLGWIGLEGTSAITKNNQNDLRRHFSKYMLGKAIRSYEDFGFFDRTDREYLRYSAELGYGGIFAGLWELSRELELGFSVELSSIPIRQETIEICEYYDINPYRLYSGGSLLAVGESEKIQRTTGCYPCTVIGNTLDSAKKVINYDGNTMYLTPPARDNITINIDELCGYI